MSSSAQLNILLAEDEEIIAMAYQEGFGYLGHRVVVACDGEEAIAALKKEVPDILLLDIIMPNMNGFEVLKAIRKEPRLKDLPVIMLTNLSQSSDEAEARELGATDYLIKSNISLGQLMDRIETVLAAKKA